MNIHTQKYKDIANNFSNKEYRDLYVENHITNGIAFQIRGMRKDRNWSQDKLASEIGTKQEAISRLENPDYGRYSLDTLKKIASSLDVALLVSFVPFSEILSRTTSLSNRNIEIPPYDEDEQLNNFTNNSNVQYINEKFTDTANGNNTFSINSSSTGTLINYG